MRPWRIRGFTAFELLIIALILGIQIAVLLPVIEATKERDRSTACLLNLKRCAQALMMYSNDWDDAVPSSGVVAASPSQSQVVEFLTGKGVFPRLQPAKCYTWPQFLQDYLRSTNCVFCPSDNPRTRVSYWYKYANDLAWRDSTLKRRRLSDYYYQTNQIAFYEHAGWHSGDAAGIKNGVKVNAAFMDSRVALITVANGPSSYPPAADERTGAAATRLGEPMYYDCRDNSPNPVTVHNPADFIDPRTCYDSL